MRRWDMDNVSEMDTEALLAFAAEAIDMFEAAIFDPTTDQCQWCLWSVSDGRTHSCLLNDVVPLVERVRL